VFGYDILTKPNSDVEFSSMTVSISSPEKVDIVRQNLGFDPENGVSTVTLDLNELHYYFEVTTQN